MATTFDGNGITFNQIGKITQIAGNGSKYKVFRSKSIKYGFFVYENGSSKPFPTRGMDIWHYKWLTDLIYICNGCGKHYVVNNILSDTNPCTTKGCKGRRLK